MRALVYLVAATLDGFVAAPDRSDPTTTIFDVAGEHLPAQIAEYPETMPGHVREPLGLTGTAHRHFDTVLEGRVSYTGAVEAGIADAYPHLRHLVFSRTLTAVADPAVELVSGDPVDRVRALKEEAGLNIWLVGGGSLAGSLRDEIDEIHLKLYPVVTGSGTPLVDAPFDITRFDLLDSRVFPDSVVWLRYRRAR